jgi:hypothetical protein
MVATRRRRLLLPLALEVAEGGGELRGAVAVQPPRLEGLGQQGLGLRPGLVAQDRPAQPPAAGAGGAVTIVISFQEQEERVSDFAVIAADAPAAERTTAPVVAVSSQVEATTIHGAKRTTFWSVSRRRQVPAGGGRQGPS